MYHNFEVKFVLLISVFMDIFTWESYLILGYNIFL